MRPISFALPALLAALPAAAEVPRVVTDLPAVQSLAAQVMGDLGTPEILLAQGADAHHYQMKPSQAAALQDAGLILWVGPEMTPWLERARAAMAPEAPSLALLDAEGTFRRSFAAGAHDHDHEAEAEAAGEDDHDHEGVDPHAWLDPQNGQVWLGLIAAELGRLDPENAATYAANAAAAQARLADLDAALTAELAPVAGKPFVTFHEAYGYFADHYGLAAAGSIALGDATEPGAAHLAELQAEMAKDGIVCAFPEGQHDPRQLAQLVEGTGVRIGDALDPSGSTLPYGPGLYEALLRGLGASISACLKG
ncbi:zinc ABC transporter substrate-binding protein [Rhodobacter xanthinilyticus]|uniref:High-affinity zinc uptake system protein ZnuA n=1 Tax=Rhodobacter xanthinilyticus TaxID=1850250 RepID=A0A1D9MDY1_9RHOB|nr:zinc ABC transporter substrate-binding protein [Rhodobacter xanthinilyticus]AOZ70013.1 zinc ABC transporter substrate-binding protein [Rhodobacter xanthinilyticus]